MMLLWLPGARKSRHHFPNLKAFTSLIFLVIAPLCASAGPSNRTIDDQTGDAVTGVLPVYQPADLWNYGPNCSACIVKPNAAQVNGSSWHDTTVGQEDVRNITLTFTGT
jgi:hypothetical protein